MYKLVLIRHGESTWNKENRFTGWVDVDLTEQGRNEAYQAGELLKEAGYTFDIAYRRCSSARSARCGTCRTRWTSCTCRSSTRGA